MITYMRIAPGLNAVQAQVAITSSDTSRLTNFPAAQKVIPDENLGPLTRTWCHHTFLQGQDHQQFKRKGSRQPGEAFQAERSAVEAAGHHPDTSQPCSLVHKVQS